MGYFVHIRLCCCSIKSALIIVWSPVSEIFRAVREIFNLVFTLRSCFELEGKSAENCTSNILHNPSAKLSKGTQVLGMARVCHGVAIDRSILRRNQTTNK